MEISLKPGDVLVEFLIALIAALIAGLVGFVFSVLYRRAAPWVSDYLAARRSASAARKQIPRLEVRLAMYEADFADPRLFLGRLIVRAAFAIILAVSVLLGQIMSLTFFVYANIASLSDQMSVYYSLKYVAILILTVSGLSSFFCGAQMSSLVHELHPDLYRDRMRHRIALLRDRVVAGETTTPAG
jgi:hypothetical protein